MVSGNLTMSIPPTLSSCSSKGSNLSSPGHRGNDTEGQFFGQFKLADVPKLKAIFFAEFDNSLGVVIRYQIPEEVVTKARFASFSAAIIPKQEMFDRLIKVNFQDYKVMGHPIGLTHKDYHRERLIFNMCFVVARESTVDCMYEPLVQKCAEYLMELEQECRFVHRHMEHKMIPDIMTKIFNDLNAGGECVHAIESTMTTMYLKLCPSYRGVEPPTINPYMVPMFIRQLDFNSGNSFVDKMDVLSQKIIPKIDGIRCVKEIAAAISIDQDLVARCIRNLFFYECVSMVPLFLFSNTYVATEKLHDFYENPKQIEECLEFIRIRNEKNDLGPLPLFHDVFRLYMSLRCGRSLREWCAEMHPQRYNVDERRLVQFGMHHNFIRKLSIYPVSTLVHSGDKEKIPKIFGLCDGTKALEDLAVVYATPPDQMLYWLEKSGKFKMISK